MRQAVIVAGGKATRMRERLGDVPKVLAPVEGRPFLEWVLRVLVAQDVRTIHLCLGHGAREVIDSIPALCPKGSSVTYSVEERPLGVVGALIYALPWLDEYFVFLPGDVYPTVPIARLVTAFDAQRMDMLMTVGTRFDAHLQSNVALANDQVCLYSKEPDGSVRTHLDLGIFILKRVALSRFAASRASGIQQEREIPRNHEHTRWSRRVDETEFFSDLIERKCLGAFDWPFRPLQVGDPPGHHEVCDLARRKALPTP